MIEWINYDKCTHCEICFLVCPMDVFKKAGKVTYIDHSEDCMTCFLCEIDCPVPGAIYVGPYRAQPIVLPYGEYDMAFLGKKTSGPPKASTSEEE